MTAIATRDPAPGPAAPSTTGPVAPPPARHPRTLPRTEDTQMTSQQIQTLRPDRHTPRTPGAPDGLERPGQPVRLADLPCRREDPDLWFAESPEDVEYAKSLCAPCPLREACLGGALERAEPWGVWGGQLLQRGTVVPRKRPRGRPRKNPVAA